MRCSRLTLPNLRGWKRADSFSGLKPDGETAEGMALIGEVVNGLRFVGVCNQCERPDFNQLLRLNSIAKNLKGNQAHKRFITAILLNRQWFTPKVG